MLSPEEERYILSRASVPEHIVSLMVPISEGEPSLIDGYIYFSKDNSIIFVGYPLDHDFTTENLEKVLNNAIKKHRPVNVWLIAPEIPLSLTQICKEREGDYYYKLDLRGLEIKKDLMRLIRRASGDLTVEKGRCILKEHKELISEFIERERPNPLIRGLFLSMGEYVKQSETSIVLSAYTEKGVLTALYVVELGAYNFATYVIGSHSRKNYIPGSSDILFYEMINLAKEYGKGYIHLGLGVNEGIRRFKKKWGGVPYLRYEFCKLKTGNSEMLEMLKSIEKKL